MEEVGRKKKKRNYFEQIPFLKLELRFEKGVRLHKLFIPPRMLFKMFFFGMLSCFSDPDFITLNKDVFPSAREMSVVLTALLLFVCFTSLNGWSTILNQ